MEPLLISIEDAARLVGVGRDRAYEKVKSGEWPSELFGKRRRMIPRAKLLDMYGAGKPEEPANA